MQKPQLVLVHGIVRTLDYFNPAARLARADVHFVDLLGYGSQRSAPAGRLSLGSQANHVAAFIDSAGLGRVWLLAHSMGGAVAMILADRRPDLVSGIINAEGNFTLKDAFWSRKIVARTPDDWSDEYEAQKRDLPATLRHWGIEPTPEQVDWIRQILANQPARTVYAMARAILAETRESEFLPLVRRVLQSGIPLHLVAGVHSAEDWGIPDFVREEARSCTAIADAGHLMMLERPEEFCRAIDAILAEHAGADAGL